MRKLNKLDFDDYMLIFERTIEPTLDLIGEWIITYKNRLRVIVDAGLILFHVNLERVYKKQAGYIIRYGKCGRKHPKVLGSAESLDNLVDGIYMYFKNN